MEEMRRFGMVARPDGHYVIMLIAEVLLFYSVFSCKSHIL